MRLTPRGTRTSGLRRIRQREAPQKRWYEGLEPASGQGPVRYGPTGRWRRNEGWRAAKAAPAVRRPLLCFVNRAEHDGARESRQRAWAGYRGTVGEESTRNVVGVRYVVLPGRIVNHREFARRMWEARRATTYALVCVGSAGLLERPVNGRCRAFLDALKGGAGPATESESGLEDRLGEAMEEAGLEAERQVRVGRYRLDFALRKGERQLCVEADGRRWHTNEEGERVDRDLWRDACLQAAGWKTLRFWDHEIESDPTGCVLKIREALDE